MWEGTNRINFQKKPVYRENDMSYVGQMAACLTGLKTPESKLICVRGNKSYRSSFFLTSLSSNLYKRHWSFRDDFMKQNVQKEKSKARDVKGKGTRIRNTFTREVL